jgi:hypothetical protein
MTGTFSSYRLRRRKTEQNSSRDFERLFQQIDPVTEGTVNEAFESMARPATRKPSLSPELPADKTTYRPPCVA